MYKNQSGVGRALSKIFKEGKIKREDIWITSKVSLII
jgi:diketogulonate reductase-like aldo/keto reductase